jgi:hypothetical protein
MFLCYMSKHVAFICCVMSFAVLMMAMRLLMIVWILVVRQYLCWPKQDLVMLLQRHFKLRCPLVQFNLALVQSTQFILIFCIMQIVVHSTGLVYWYWFVVYPVGKLGRSSKLIGVANELKVAWWSLLCECRFISGMYWITFFSNVAQSWMFQIAVLCCLTVNLSPSPQYTIWITA